jgi:hypothetical protein
MASKSAAAISACSDPVCRLRKPSWDGVFSWKNRATWRTPSVGFSMASVIQRHGPVFADRTIPTL